MIKTYIDGVLQESGSLPPTPTNPTTKFLNGNVEWTEISIGSGGYASNLYFTETNSTINPAYKQISYVNQATTTVKSVTVNNTESLIQAYMFDSPIGITQIDAGSWIGNLFGYVSSATGVSTLKIEVYSRTVGGVETLLFEKYSNEIDNTTGEYIKTETVQPVFTVNATDYLVVKVYGKTTATANRTISYVIGDGNASYVNTPLALRHNQLRGLNDDVNFQHITATDRTKLNNLSGTNTGDETASTIINKIGDGSKINSNYLPSYVDDVLEFANVASFPATGEVGKIYIALDFNLTYRWGGSGYVEISPSIALGETSATAYRGDRGKIAYDHSQLTSGTNPHNTTFANIQAKPTTVAGYGITDGVTLTGTQTLTNKTLTNPVLDGTATGTAITITGEPSKIARFTSGGFLSGMFQTIKEHIFSNLKKKTRYSNTYLNGLTLTTGTEINTYGTAYDTGLAVDDLNFRVMFEGILQANSSGAGQGLSPTILEWTKANNEITFDGFTIKVDVASNNLTLSLKHSSITSGGQMLFAGILKVVNTAGTGTSDSYYILSNGLSYFKQLSTNLITAVKAVIRSTDTTALNVQNASGTSVFNVDTQNQAITGSAVGTTATANTIVKRDANGAIVNSQYKLSALNTAPALPTATGTAGEIRGTSEGIYFANDANSWVGGGRNYFRTSISNNGGGVGIFSSLTTAPQFGKLIAYDTTDYTKFCVYNLYKSSPTALIQYSLVMNNVLAISAVNTSGTIALNDTSANIKMSATRELISG